MNALIETAAAAPLASALVNLFKHAWPTAPAWALVLVSLAVGIGGMFVVSLAEGHILTAQLAAQDAIQGVAVALAASGLDRVATAAQTRRDEGRIGR